MNERHKKKFCFVLDEGQTTQKKKNAKKKRKKKTIKHLTITLNI